MSENTKNITIKGLYWNTLDRFGNQAVVTILGIITARLLVPEAFGIISILMIFTTIATAFVDSGLATSLVRTKNVSEADYSTMFVFNLLVSIGFYLVLFFAAPYIERFNGIDNLALYARVLFLQIIAQSLGIVQYVKILKNFQFHITAKVNILAIFFSGLIVVALALMDKGVWALILQPVLYALFRSVLFWLWGDWKMSFNFSKASLRNHLGFSVSFMISNMMGKILSPFYYSFIGKHYSVEDTGYYFQGNKWGETPSMLISSIIQGTTLSTLTPIQDDYPRFLNACRKTMATLAFVLFPVSILAICIARPAFDFALTETWLPSVPFFQLLCFGSLFISITDMNVNFLNIKGRSKFSLSLEVIKFSLAILLLFLTYQQGFLAIIYGQISVRIVCFIIASIMSGRVYGYNTLSQLKDLFPSLLMSLLAAIVAYLPLHFNLIQHNLLLLIVQTLIFAGIYLGLNQLTGNDVWQEVLALVRKKIIKK